jgi:hypothetical protein
MLGCVATAQSYDSYTALPEIMCEPVIRSDQIYRLIGVNQDWHIADAPPVADSFTALRRRYTYGRRHPGQGAQASIRPPAATYKGAQASKSTRSRVA